MEDQNVFDIQQGVAISLFVKRSSTAQKNRKLMCAELVGTRGDKYSTLVKDSNKIIWSEVSPLPPLYQFVQIDSTLQPEYMSYISLPELMPQYSSGTETGFDALLVDFSPEELKAKIRSFLDPHSTDKEVADTFAIKKGTARKLLDLRESFRADFSRNAKAYVTKGMYRLFDHRYYYYKKEYLKTNSSKIMRNLTDHRNLALVAFRQQSQDGFQHAFVTDILGDKNAVSLRTREINYYFPLYLVNEHKLSVDDRSNVTPNFAHMPALARHDAETLFAYVYAVLHAPSYRSRYVDYLKTDFPRVPLTSNNALFSLLSGLGFDLIALHTLNSEYSRASWNIRPDRALDFGHSGSIAERLTHGIPQRAGN